MIAGINERLIDFEIRMTLNDTLNTFLSDYHACVESLVLAHDDCTREELTAKVDKFLADKRTEWEATCLVTLKAELGSISDAVNIKMADVSPSGVINMLRELQDMLNEGGGPNGRK